MFKRGLVFVTFCGCCVAIALIVASLGTKYWVNAAAKRTTNPQESDGKIHFGLFDGRKELNVAYGWRSFDVDVIHLLKYEPEFMKYGFWLGTLTCLCVGLLFSILGAISAAVNSAITTSHCLTGLGGLFLSNTLSLIANLAAVGFWLAQFYTSIQENVLSREDRDNMWTSEGMAELGFSFWFAVGAIAANFVNLIVLCIANSDRDVDPVIPMLEEKTNGAIMLY